MELVKNRHAVETRVEKLSDNQLKSLHRRLEKWGLPVPVFFKHAMGSRGIEVASQPASAAQTPRAAGGGAHSAAGGASASPLRGPSPRIGDTSELDATVLKVLEGMNATDGW